jgi:hypothetical protein
LIYDYYEFNRESPQFADSTRPWLMEELLSDTLLALEERKKEKEG